MTEYTNPTVKDFRVELKICREKDSMTERMGLYVLGIIQSKVLKSTILKGVNKSVRDELFDMLVSLSVEKWDVIMASEYPYAYINALAKNRIINFKSRNMRGGTRDIYGGKLVYRDSTGSYRKAEITYLSDTNTLNI